MIGQATRFFLFVGFAALCFAQAALTNDSIINSVKAGLGEDRIVTSIRAQPGKYSTGLDDLTALKAAGVSEKIIDAMIEKGSGSGPSTTRAAADNNQAGLTETGPEPEFRGTVYWLDRANNKLNALERQKPRGDHQVYLYPASRPRC